MLDHRLQQAGQGGKLDWGQTVDQLVYVLAGVAHRMPSFTPQYSTREIRDGLAPHPAKRGVVPWEQENFHGQMTIRA
jgi:hypothetical protein